MSESGPSWIDRTGMRLFGSLARVGARKRPDLDVRLLRARFPMVPVAFLAGVYMRVLLAFLLGIVFTAAVLAFSMTSGVDAMMLIAGVSMPVLLAIGTYGLQMMRPDSRIKARSKDLEQNLPYGLNFMAALAGAGVVPVEVFGSLASQDGYGELGREAAWIYRDTKLFNKDLVDALKDGARRSPSGVFEEFLYGSVHTITSGGDLRSYFMSKAEQYTLENRRKQKGFLESLGVMAESYVVVAAAAPLFLIVIIAVMILMSTDAKTPTMILNFLILIGMPLLHAAFYGIIGGMSSE